MSAKALVAPTNVEEIDGALRVLSDFLKTSSSNTRPVYIRKINKLLDQRNRLTEV